MDTAPAWAPLAAADLPELCAVAAQAHPALPERPEVFAEKLRLFPEGCLKFTLGGRLAGYGLCHPWTLGSAPALDAFLGGLPAAADCVFIHDVALLPAARGRGAAAAYAHRAGELALERGLGAVALVAVYGTAPLWGRFGFRPAAAAEGELESYGGEAEYMVKKL